MPSWIAVDHPDFRTRLRQLELPLNCLDGFWSTESELTAEMSAVLEYRDGCVQLRPLDKALGNPVTVDFIHGKTGFRFLRASHEMVVKEVAGRSKEPLTVFDATAGLGRDSFILAAAGYPVTAVERHPAIACLLPPFRRRQPSPVGSSLQGRSVCKHSALHFCVWNTAL